MRTPPLILIVDDNPTNVDILQARLAANNYEIITAVDGEEGLAKARDEKPDLILLDIMMPKMDGLEVCRHLREDASLPFMPIILVTAKADSKDVVAGLEAGGDEYLTKPVDHAALVARVKSMLRIKSLHDTVLEQSAQLKAQLETATQIQSLFWPKIPALKAGGHIWAKSIPATYVGGDLYDVIPLPDDSLLAYVADVSGKGVPAALFMAMTKTMLKSAARLLVEPEYILADVNREIARNNPSLTFVTVFLGILDLNTGNLTYSCAGHNPQLFIGRKGNSALLSDAQCPAIGLDDTFQYRQASVHQRGSGSVYRWCHRSPGRQEPIVHTGIPHEHRVPDRRSDTQRTDHGNLVPNPGVHRKPTTE